MAFLIDIEGTDGCGKQTQSLMLIDALKGKGYDALRQDFPNYDSASSGPVKMFLNGEFGESVYSLTPYQICPIYAIDRLCTFKKLMPRLKDDTVLVLDRYTNSNVIHNASKFTNKRERNRCIKWIYNFEYKTLDLPEPNIVFFLDMPVDVSIKMADARAKANKTKKDIYENNNDYQIKTYQRAKKIASELGWTVIECSKNGEPRPREEIHKDILKIVLKKLKEN